MLVFQEEGANNAPFTDVTVTVQTVGSDEGCDGTASTTASGPITTNGILWGSATEFDIPAIDQPVSNGTSITVNGTYNPTPTPTLTGSMSFQQSVGSPCVMTGNYSMTLQPAQ